MAPRNRPVRPEIRWRQSISDHVIALKWAPDGKTLAAASVSGPISLFDVASGTPRLTLPGHGFGTTALDWHPDSARLASCGQDGRIRTWNTSSGTELTSLDGGAAWVECLAWSPKGDVLISSAGKKFRAWNDTGDLITSYADQEKTISGIAWPPRGKEFAVSSFGGVRFYRADAPESVRAFETPRSILTMAWSPDAKMIAGGCQDASVHFWFVKSGEELSMSGYPGKVASLSWHRSSRLLATSGAPAVIVWDCSGKGPADRKPIMLEHHQATIVNVAFQNRSDVLASGCEEGVIAFWDPDSSTKKLAAIGVDEAIARLAWSPGDGQLAVGGDLGLVALLTA